MGTDGDFWIPSLLSSTQHEHNHIVYEEQVCLICFQVISVKHCSPATEPSCYFVLSSRSLYHPNVENVRVLPSKCIMGIFVGDTQHFVMPRESCSNAKSPIKHKNTLTFRLIRTFFCHVSHHEKQCHKQQCLPILT